MSDPAPQDQHDHVIPEGDRSPAGDPALPETATSTPPSPPAPGTDDESTVGTGTSIALGCIAGTVILIVIGLIVIGIIAIVS